MIRLNSPRHTRHSVCISHTSEDGLFTCFLTPPTPACCLRFNWMIVDKRFALSPLVFHPAEATRWQSALTMGGSGTSRVTGAGKPPQTAWHFKSKKTHSAAAAWILSVCYMWDWLPGKVVLFCFNAYSLTWFGQARMIVSETSLNVLISLYFPVEWSWGKWKQKLFVFVKVM